MAEEIEVVCGPVVAGGDAIVKTAGQKTLFVEGGLPGERVQVEIIREARDLRRGRVTKLIETSPHRIEPECWAHDDGCGGCTWGYMSTEGHRLNKLQIVDDALVRIARVTNAPVSFGHSVPFDRYRTTARLGVTDGRAGFRRRGSHDVLVNNACDTVSPAVAEMILEGRYGRNSEVTMRYSTSQGAAFALVDDAVGVEVPPGVEIVKRGDRFWLEESVSGRSFRVSAQAFFQSGLQAIQLLTNEVVALVPRNVRWVVDAYAGVGVLGGVIASRRQCRLTSIESNAYAADDARHNLSDVDGEVIEAEVAMVELSGDNEPDLVIADPSRTGLGPSATAALVALGASHLILVSCDPASMARDITLLRPHGFHLEKVVVLDLFAQTPHVETVALLTR